MKLFVVAAAVMLGSTPSPSETGVPEAASTREIERVARALEALVRVERAQLAVLRLSLEEQRISPLNDELRRVRGDLRDGAEEIAQWNAMREQQERAASEATRAGRSEEASELRAMIEQADEMIRSREDRLRGLERRIFELQDEIERARKGLAALEGKLEDLLAEPTTAP